MLSLTGFTFVPECGDRLNVRDIVIFVGDGATNPPKPDLVAREAQRLADNGIRTFAIGMFAKKTFVPESKKKS